MLGMLKGGDVLRAPVPYGPRGARGGTLAVERGTQMRFANDARFAVHYGHRQCKTG